MASVGLLGGCSLRPVSGQLGERAIDSASSSHPGSIEQTSSLVSRSPERLQPEPLSLRQLLEAGE
jgi:hypothetical protein